MAQVVQMAGAEFMTAGEQKTANYLEEKLPADWVVVCNKELLTQTGFAVEVDFIIIGVHRLFVVEEKSWHGRIHGDENYWVVRSGESRKSPLNKVARVVRQLAGRLRDTVPGLRAALGEQHFVEGIVILSDPSGECRVNDPRRGRVLHLDGCDEDLELLDREGKSTSIKPFRESVAKSLHLLPDRPKIPRVIATYEVHEVLPPGPYYRAFLAKHAGGGPDPLRVLKLFQLRQTASDVIASQQQELILREYRTLEALGETSLVPRVDHYQEWADGEFLVIPFHPVPGRNLRTLMQQGDKFDARSYLETIRIAFESLSRIHQGGILHRGLTPDCVHVSDGDPPRIAFADFHFARVPLQQTIAPAVDDLEWLDPYRSPECRMGFEVASAASDIYSLALCFYELLSGLDVSGLDSPETGNARLRPLSEVSLRVDCGDKLVSDLNDFFVSAGNDQPAAGVAASAAVVDQVGGDAQHRRNELRALCPLQSRMD